MHQRRLSGAVLADERMDLAPPDLERDATNRAPARNGLDDIAHDQAGGGIRRVLGAHRPHHCGDIGRRAPNVATGSVATRAGLLTSGYPWSEVAVAPTADTGTLKRGDQM